MTKTERQIIFLQDFCGLILQAKELNIKVIMFDFIRTAQQQAKRYTKGRRGIPGEKIITQCDGYKKKSKHQGKLAGDLAIIINGRITWNPDDGYKILGEIWKSMNHRWGGDFSFKDYCHFEA